MDWFVGSRLALFAAMSTLIHAGVFATLGRRPVAAALSFEPLSQTLSGDTLVLDPVVDSPLPADEESPEPMATPTATRNHAPRSAAPRTWGPIGPGVSVPAAIAVVGPPPVFGAVGVRYATDLATTFTRAFPQAASVDGVWSSVPFGGAGEADLTLVLDDAGQLLKSAISGSASAALRQSIERTLVLLAARSFTARGAVTRLRIRAQVSRDDRHDGLHGDVFALSAGSFSGDVGSAFFALPPGTGTGRRVDVDVRLLP